MPPAGRALPCTYQGNFLGKSFPGPFKNFWKILLLKLLLQRLYRTDCNVPMGPLPHLTVQNLFCVGTDARCAPLQKNPFFP